MSGGRASLARLARVRSEDPELERVLSEARMKLERGLARSEAGCIDGSRAPARALEVLLHVRAGLEEILADELGRDVPSGGARPGSSTNCPNPTSRFALPRAHVLALRIPARARERRCRRRGRRVGFGAFERPRDGRFFSTFTRGPIRYRIEWADAGKKRGATFRAAEAVARVRPALVNDPQNALWEVVVSEKPAKSGSRVYVEIWPRALPDPRFEYRKKTLPASSHPTIAAALARVAGVVKDDVIWDPFVGAGGELVERSLLGPYARMFGTDIAPEALSAARREPRCRSRRTVRALRGGRPVASRRRKPRR